MHLSCLGLSLSLLIGPAVEGVEAPAVDAGPDASAETVSEPEAELPQPEPEPSVPTEDALALEQAVPAGPPPRRYPLGCATSKSCFNLSITGIVIGTLGVGSVITGSVLLALPDKVIPETPAYVTSTQPAGLVAITLGVGITVTAILMEVAAHTGYKKQGRKARAFTSEGFQF